VLYYLFKYLDEAFDLPGAGLFQYISFRAGMAAMLSLLIGMTFGKQIIDFLRKKQIGESIRELGLQGQLEKKGTPTMGGLIIVSAILIPVLLFTRITNVYIVLLIITTIFTALIGFADDYIKVFLKDKQGLKGRFKVAGQITLGLVIGTVLYFNEHVVVREFSQPATSETVIKMLREKEYVDVKSTKTTIPFLKGNAFNYAQVWPFSNDYLWVF